MFVRSINIIKALSSWTDTDDPDRVVLHPVPGERVKVLPAVMQVIGTVDVIVLEVPTRDYKQRC